MSTCVSPVYGGVGRGSIFPFDGRLWWDRGRLYNYPINDRAVSVANPKVHNDLAVDQNQEASSIAMSSLRSRESAPLINFVGSCNVCYSRRQRYRRLAVDAAHGAPCCISTVLGTCADVSVPSKVQPGSSTEVMEIDRDVPVHLLSAVVHASVLWA